ncbi:MAG: TetR/AcrR family transcriptional regulator [Reyranella sp.]|uniref:TetR/AcrR family transcriptional regulator n=1 Tax=Reyranella sp. TaxID=1929291 RepID=UPI003D12853D
MKIIGFPVPLAGLRDSRIARDEGVRRTLIQTTLDLIQAGDVEPTAAAVATIAGVPRVTLTHHFPSLADLYAAAFDLAVKRVLDLVRAVDSATPLANRVELLVSDRARLFEEWLPLWRFAERVRGIAPPVGVGVVHFRKVLRERLATCFASELRALDPDSRKLVLDSLDAAFGLDSWMNLRAQLRLSAVRASRTWRFTAGAIVQRAFVEHRPMTVS